MSIAVWPPISPEELRRKAAESLDRDRQWIVRETISLCHELKHGIEDCYALLAPIDPGSTLVMSTHRNEKVKGTITRVGTRIIKGVRMAGPLFTFHPSLLPLTTPCGPKSPKPKPKPKLTTPKQTINLQLRTLAPSQITLSPSEPIHIPALDALHTHLTQAIDLLGLTLSSTPTASSLASALTVLSESISESRALLKGTGNSDADPAWQTSSCPAHHFGPPLPSNISFYVALQDSSIVLWLRALEPADVPVHFGLKLGLAIGTVRRLEHDEMDVVFKYHPEGDGGCEPKRGGSDAKGPPMSGKKRVAEEVFVREKVRVESADPSLISLYSKLGQLGHMLSLAEHNLAAIMGDDPDV